MMKKIKNKAKGRAFTFIIVPHSTHKAVITFKLPERIVHAGLYILCGIILLASSSLIYSSALSRKLVNYNQMRRVNDEQAQKIETFFGETNQLKQEITELADRDNEIRRLLGLKVKETKIESKAEDLAKIQRESFSELLASVNRIRERFVSTPSLWPVYGKITSHFGYRFYPWRGFHSGLDISTYYGAPIRAAAAGSVTFTGWQSGFGRTVIIDHGYGVSTLYGHTSKILVLQNTKVKKGQLIAFTGISGLTTGSHLHYEIRKNGVAINPIRYLDLDILSAAKIFNRSGQGGI